MKRRVPTAIFVDDDATVLAALARIFEVLPLKCHFFQNPREALDAIETLRPDVVVSDHRMPGLTGVEFLEAVAKRHPRCHRILLSGHTDLETALDAVNRGGVSRIVSKPWDNRALMGLVFQAAEAAALERFARERLDGEGLLSTVRTLAAAIEAKDPYTRGHSELVGRYAAAIARDLGLSEREVEAARLGGLLHDCGKVGVPDEILLKPGRLSEEEYAIMKRHPEVGMRIVAPLEALPEEAADAVLHHHEHYDGSGYPHGLAGESIHLVARIVHVADAYEAMTAARIYRAPRTVHYVREEFERWAGRQFDPQVVQSATRLLEAGVFDAIRAEARVQPQQGCRERREELAASLAS
ncbi:MAG: HD domain-containing protein [Deltaproteobacteria bacterium]|nr:MAG: HD domain-containing protein [Deltaproteobacteria bacterium]